MPHALVTGATGLVGSHIVERLLADGWSVRALVRDPGRAAWLSRAGVALHPGDTLDSATFAHAAQGSDVVFHAAAAITPRGGWEAYRATNIEGTRNAVEAARGAGARLLHVSSVAVYGPGRYRDGGRGTGDGEGGTRDEGRGTNGERTARGSRRLTDEDVALEPLPATAHYARSKRDSESIVLDAHRAGRIWATAVRPCVIYGRRDRQFVPRAARLLRTGLAPVVGDGATTLAIVHAANVADGAVRAATTDAAGGRAYNLANDGEVTVREFVRLAAEGLGREVRTFSVPLPLARAAIAVAAAAAGLAGGHGRRAMVGSTLSFVTRDNPFSSDRARDELEWRPVVRADEGIVEAFRWWTEQR
ncbi:MAG TPA: NAD-dependent epimerase/dehydratase family protein [Gemmatimonadaceae bacterium]